MGPFLRACAPLLILASSMCLSCFCSLSRHMLVDRLSKGEEVSALEHCFLFSGYLFTGAAFSAAIGNISALAGL